MVNGVVAGLEVTAGDNPFNDLAQAQAVLEHQRLGPDLLQRVLAAGDLNAGDRDLLIEFLQDTVNLIV
jgi:hypothetical protein